MFWARHSWIFNPRCSLNSMTTSLRMSRLLGKCAKDSSLFSSSFHPLGLHAVALCPAFPLFGASTVSGSPHSGEHSPVSAALYCLQLFPMGLLLSAVTRRFVLLVPLGLRSFLVIWFLGNSGSTLRFQPVSFSQFVALSVLSWM